MSKKTDHPPSSLAEPNRLMLLPGYFGGGEANSYFLRAMQAYPRFWALLLFAAAVTGGLGHIRPIIRSGSAIGIPLSTAQARSPGARHDAVFAYDITRKEMVLYGGAVTDASGQGVLRSDLWAWSGSAWRQLVPSDGVVPPARGAPHLAYDAARQRIVMFGGRLSGLVGDIWEWDGDRWHEIKSDTLPILHAAVAYDRTRRRVVASSGIDNTGITRKLRGWDGRKWQVLDSAGPPVSKDAGITAVLTIMPSGEFVAVTQQSGRSSDSVAMLTWRWSGTTWARGELGPAMTSLQPATSAPDGTIFIYQRPGERLSVPLMHTRSPSGTWTSVPQPTGPEQKGSPAFGYDPDRKRVVLYGTALWEWDGTRWEKRP